MSEQTKVKLTIKKDFSNEYILEQLEASSGSFEFTEYNQAWLEIVIGRGGKKINAIMTPEGNFAVSGDHWGLDEYIMIDYRFIEMDSIISDATPYVKGKVYRMVDSEDQLGFFVSMDFDEKTKGFVYTLTCLKTFSPITGTTMAEISDEEIEMVGGESRSAYYKKA